MCRCKVPAVILAIESSCDETAAAVVANGDTVQSSVIHTQIDTHRLYGGVVPEIASRQHVQHISAVVAKALSDAGISVAQLDAIAVTQGPGLVGALLVGVSYAKGLAWAAGKPLIGVNHMMGHIAANRLSGFEPPFLCLVVSGGHTELVAVEGWSQYTYLGGTVDDAAGEAFDKIARVLGLPYPGGKSVDELARWGNPAAYAFPRALMGQDNLDFSFSGMKTAVISHVQKHGNEDLADLCASVQAAIVDVLCQKTRLAAEKHGFTRIALAGGVAANSGLRAGMQQLCAQRSWQLQLPEMAYCTDNAAMIGAAAYEQYCAGEFAHATLNANPALEL
ncbi:MAG: tRNA (adenosine(37)-N6)-threonylcarbamoyltransferase complex transferase subunit TsaD [Eubacteriales bacterium]|nr:tRNA (adenosine(37)-N6)-threonylcarbamoyltransferase complex transferase subunit TsaD [Eubacteriales bacterium]